MDGKVKIDGELFTTDDFIKLLKLNGRFESLMEIAQPNYDQSIRFMFTLDPQVLLGRRFLDHLLKRMC